MDDSFDVSRYLERIGYEGSLQPSAETLRALHRAHLMAVPFENLDIHLSRPVVLGRDQVYRKIVSDRRGGFCYELNSAFGELLRQLGFSVTLLSARVHVNGGEFGPEFDHLLLRVDLAEPWLADVGFGDLFLEPLRLDVAEQQQGDRGYRLERRELDLVLWEQKAGDEWQLQYAFRLRARALEEFEAMCRFHQTSPDSHFTRNRVCSLPTSTGRVTLSGNRLIVSGPGGREERVLNSDAEISAVLRDEFGISLE